MRKSVVKMIREYAKHTGKSEKKLRRVWNRIPWNEREAAKEEITGYNIKAIEALKTRRKENLK